jgi:hypothetical protein
MEVVAMCYRIKDSTLMRLDMVAIKSDMKTVQIRVPQDLADDVAIVAAASKKSVPGYVAEVLRAAVARDMPQAVKVAKQRSEALKKSQQQPDEEGGAK